MGSITGNKKKTTLITLNEWDPGMDWNEIFSCNAGSLKLHFCELETTNEYAKLMFHIPAKEKKPIDYILFLYKKEIIIITRTQKELEVLQKHFETAEKKNQSPAEFLYEWLQSFTRNDLIYIETLEREIALLEAEILDGTIEDFNHRILTTKSKIARFYRYYNQLMDLTDKLTEENDFNQKETENFTNYKEALTHLSDEAKFVREYAMDVQEIYQAEIEIKQNNVMKILTIVATIFFPLSLIAGWYGMNFKYMPEINNPYSYPVVIGVSILIIIFCLYVFKKKKYW